LDGCFNECSMNKCVDVGMIALISIEINEWLDRLVIAWMFIIKDVWMLGWR
jgi:hypothetical protein